LLQKQEEQRQQLQAKLAQRGEKRAFNASRGKTNTITILFERNLFSHRRQIIKENYISKFIQGLAMYLNLLIKIQLNVHKIVFRIMRYYLH
jgi:hypothetical protein